MTRFARHFLLALQFFTRIPVTGRLAQWVGFSPALLRASAAHFPGVGWVVGLLVASVTGLTLDSLPGSAYAPLVAATLGTVFGVLLTGAFHEDGLADVADGLGGSGDAPRALEIMKDSRIGAFGAIAIVLALLLKTSLLALLGSLDSGLLCAALFLAHVVSRGWPLLLIRLLPHVGDTALSKSKPLADQISRASLGVALLWSLLAFAAVTVAQESTQFIVQGIDLFDLLPAFSAALGASALAFGVMWRWLARRLGGFTGDCLGATQQVCELAFYLGLALGL